MERRVVVTGLGAITPIGNNVEEFWKGIKEGKCGIDEITKFDTTNFKVKLAAEVKGYNPEEYFDRREAKRLDLYSQYAMIASREAFNTSTSLVFSSFLFCLFLSEKLIIFSSFIFIRL